MRLVATRSRARKSADGEQEKLRITIRRFVAAVVRLRRVSRKAPPQLPPPYGDGYDVRSRARKSADADSEATISDISAKTMSNSADHESVNRETPERCCRYGDIRPLARTDRPERDSP